MTRYLARHGKGARSGFVREIVIATLLCWASPAMGADPAEAPSGVATPRVRYVSQEHVYLDSGRASGIAAGDTLTVHRDGRVVARLLVDFAAEHSATCIVLPSGTEEKVPTSALRAGDIATVADRTGTAPDTTGAPQASSAPPRRERSFPAHPGPTTRGSRAGTRTWGMIGLDHTQASGSPVGGEGYARSTMRVNLTVAGLAGHHSLNIHWRARRDDRGGTTRPGLPSSEWRNQVYELSIRRDPVHVPIGGEVGRFSPPVAVASGIMDGFVVLKSLATGGEAGIFAGVEPTWGTAGSHGPGKRAGVFTSLRGGAGAKMRWLAAVAAVGQYSGRSIDREFVSLRGSLDAPGAWSFAPSAILDVNRRWRRDAAGSSLSLSRLDVTGALNPRGPVTLRASYNRDRAPWTVAVRAIPDSLYERPPGESWRLNLGVRAGAWSLGAGGGNRHGAGSRSDTWFWNADARRGRLLDAFTSIALRANGYDSHLSRGISPSIELRRDPAHGIRTGLAAGSYRYEAEGVAGVESNLWFRLDGGTRLARGYDMDLQYEQASGDALPAHTARFALTRRF